MGQWRSQGDGQQFNRDIHRDVSASLRFLAAWTGTAPFITCPSAKHTIFVQRIFFFCTTDAAQILTIKDTATTPVVCGYFAASPGIGLKTLDFGPLGQAVTKGKNIDLSPAGAGLAGWIAIEAYARMVPEEGIVPSDL